MAKVVFRACQARKRIFYVKHFPVKNLRSLKRKFVYKIGGYRGDFLPNLCQTVFERKSVFFERNFFQKSRKNRNNGKNGKECKGCKNGKEMPCLAKMAKVAKTAKVYYVR